MPRKPKGSLTGPQFEILEILWRSEQGQTVSQIWQAIQRNREISRTTVLNLMDRLEKRNWLSRKKVDGVFTYFAAVERQSAEHQLTDEFLEDFFDGSTKNFLLSLLGNQKISKAEVAALKRILNEDADNSDQLNKGDL